MGTRHRAFHLALIAACGSRWLIDFYATLLDRNARYRYLAFADASIPRDAEAEHRAIVDAVLARDAASARGGGRGAYPRDGGDRGAGGAKRLAPPASPRGRCGAGRYCVMAREPRRIPGIAGRKPARARRRPIYGMNTAAVCKMGPWRNFASSFQPKRANGACGVLAALA